MIYIGADKHGLETIQFVKEYLSDSGIAYEDLGAQTKEEELPLEDLIPRVTGNVLESSDHRGILACGTGIGVAIGANKITGIRSILATDPIIGEWASVYDDCNVLCLAGWEIEKKVIQKTVDAWLNSEYDGSESRRKMLETFDTWR